MDNKEKLNNFYQKIAERTKDFNFEKIGTYIESIINASEKLAIENDLTTDQFNFRYNTETRIFDVFIGFKNFDEVVRLTIEG